MLEINRFQVELEFYVDLIDIGEPKECNFHHLCRNFIHDPAPLAWCDVYTLHSITHKVKVGTEAADTGIKPKKTSL